jgi:sulfonate transport system substrate-binding protein
MRKIISFLMCFSLTIAATVGAQQLEKVRTNSISFYTGFSIYVADQMGFFKKYGIDTEPKWFPSGAPIIQGAASGQWDMTFLGAPPAVLGGPQLKLLTVGVVLEEAPTHILVGRADFVASAKADPGKVRNAQIFVTTLSTGHYMTESCLKKMGLTQQQVRLVPSEQAATVSAFAAGQGDLAQVWPPQSTALISRGAVPLCDAREAGVSIPSVWVAHPDFVAKRPDLVVKWLRANLDAIAWMKQDEARTFDLYKKYDAFRGFNTPEDTLRAESKLAMSAMGATEQLKYMRTSAGGAPSELAKAYTDIGGFFMRVGRIKEVPDYRPFLSTSFLEQAVK